VFVALLYGFFPLDMGLGNGQIDLTITVLCLATYLLYRHGRLGTAGVVLGAIALIKPTVGIILLYFVLRRAWPLVRAFAGTALAGICVSLVTVGPTVVWEYREVAMGWANAFGVLPLNQSIHGQLSRIFAPTLDQQATGIIGALLFIGECAFPLAAAFAAYRLLRRPEPTDLRIGILQYYAVLSLLMLGTPFTENMHLTWLVPGIGILLVSISRERRPRPRDIVAILAFFALALPLAERISWAAGSNLEGRLSSGIDCYGLIALSIVLCMSAFGSPTGRARPVAGRRPT
jgi:4-amino-4-deoxy-L-arabinose transferase-like glycosyltransferase